MVRVLIPLVAIYDWPLLQFDVKNAFLNGDLVEEVYMNVPKTKKTKRKVCKLRKSLYGLKQSPRAWFERFVKVVKQNGYSQSLAYHTLFFKNFDNGEIVVLTVYVDDIVLTGNHKEEIKQLKEVMAMEFEIKDLGNLQCFLRLEMARSKKGNSVSQCKYTRDLMKKIDLKKTSLVKIPMNASVKMDRDAEGKAVDQTRYRSLIGSLLYLTASRPDITFVVGVCARFQSAPKESHMTAAKRILRYLKGCQEVGLWYPKEGGFKLVGYSDSDYAGCRVDMKSTSGTCQMLGNRLVSWFSKKQNSIATSTTEVEYIAVGSSCAQVLWMRQQLRDHDIEEKDILIMCDNTSAIAITQNPILHSRTKQIDVRYHFIRDHVEKKDITLEYISTYKQLADIFTKPLYESRFDELKNELGLIELS
ncbi:hypothetical protein DH2020_015282 [Rehmannia glutinosa]|uniref:Reverse transcriptase Ty1/copia-type domain-containing protein n=1 Tax=Rehmannia glutinosa TaxID=99300 RepID=A0ABR0WT05_REHGL